MDTFVWFLAHCVSFAQQLSNVSCNENIQHCIS